MLTAREWYAKIGIEVAPAPPRPMSWRLVGLVLAFGFSFGFWLGLYWLLVP